jgi:hypothetical protein
MPLGSNHPDLDFPPRNRSRRWSNSPQLASASTIMIYNHYNNLIIRKNPQYSLQISIIIIIILMVIQNYTFEDFSDAINNVFLMISTMLIFMMHLGFAFLEGGNIRMKNI